MSPHLWLINHTTPLVFTMLQDCNKPRGEGGEPRERVPPYLFIYKSVPYEKRGEGGKI